MADTVPIFRGDGSATDPKPQLFFNKCRSFLMDREPGWADSKQMDWFALKLEPGSEAEEWFDKLQSSEKQDMATLKPLFDTAYPPDPKATKSVQDKWDRLLKYVLDEDRMLDVDEEGVYQYVKWGARMHTLSKGIDDTNGLQVSQIRDRLPKPLRRLVGEATTFKDLADKVKAVKKKTLEEAVEDRAEVNNLRRELAARPQARSQAEASTKELSAAIASMSLARPNTQPLQALMTALAGAAAPQAVQAPRVQPNAGLARGAFQFLRHTEADIALRERDPAVRLADYQRTKLRRATNAEEYRAQIAEYERVHGNVLGTERRGYPLTPGTADAGSGECMDCGHVRHQGVACTMNKLTFKERDYRRMAGAIEWGIRRAGAARGAMGGAAAAAGPAAPNVNQTAANLFLLLTQAAGNYQAQQDMAQDQGAHIEEVGQGNGDGVSE